MSILNGIFKGLWRGFQELNNMLRSGEPAAVVAALITYLGIGFLILLLVFAFTQGSPYKCVEYRDDGLRTVYNSTTKTTTTTRERTCMVQIHKEFTGSVEVK